jgi:zinc-binding alcohol dehydrogenase/oxidoreductase
MKALVLEAVHSAPVYKIAERPEPAEDEVLVKIKAAALNHRDVYISQGLYPGIKLPVILGSDGSGIVEAVGNSAHDAWLGKSVIINPNNNWGTDEKVQDKKYHILGMPTNGCFAEYVCVKADRLAEKPENLSFEEAAALPLAGLTAYRSLFSRADLKTGERLLISGIGGGVALTAFQLAQALGVEVWVTSGSEEKIQRAVDLGAKGGINYKTEKWHKALAQEVGDGFDVILDSAGGDGFKYFIDLANPAGRIVFYGGTRGNFTLNPQKMFWKQLDILGSTMGSDQDFKDMVQFVKEHDVKPLVDQVFPLSEGASAFARMDAGEQFGKIVLKIA